MEFKDELLDKEKDIGVRCHTEEQAKALLEWAANKGLLWRNGERLDDTTIFDDEEPTIYFVAEGTYATQTDLDDDDAHDFTIYEYEEAKSGSMPFLEFSQDREDIMAEIEVHKQKILELMDKL